MKEFPIKDKMDWTECRWLDLHSEICEPICSLTEATGCLRETCPFNIIFERLTYLEQQQEKKEVKDEG